MALAVPFRLRAGGSEAPLLAASLAAWSDEQLAALLRARPDLAQPPPADLDELAWRADDVSSVERCRMGLDQWCLQVADAACLLPGPATVGALRGLLALPVDDGDLDRALGHLAGLGLLARSGDTLHLAGGLRQVAYPASLGPPAGVLLSRTPLPALKAMAGRLGVKSSGSKDAILGALSSALAEPSVIREAVASGPKGVTDLIGDMALHPSFTVSGNTYWLPPDKPVGWAVARGLLVVVSNTALAVPREVGLALRGGRPYPALTPGPPALITSVVDQAGADAAAAGRALALVADLAAVLDGLASTAPAPLKTGGLGVREVRKAAKAVGRPDAETARIIELAGVAGLVGVDRQAGAVLPLPAYDDWLDLEVPRRWAALVDAWLRCTRFVSVAGAADRSERPIPPLLHQPDDDGAPDLRRLVLRALAGLPEGGAATAEHLTPTVVWSAPALVASAGLEADLAVRWLVGEADLLGLRGLGCLSTAGRRAVAGDQAGAATALAHHAPATVHQVLLQADLTAVAAGELAPSVRKELELLADVESTGAATTYRFSEASLRRGLSAGRGADDIMGFLEERAAKGVPQPLAYLVADAARRYGRVRVGTARCYVRSDDPSLLAELLRGRRAASLGLRELAPTVAVTDAEPATVLAALHAAGHSAAEEDGTGALVVARAGPRRGAAARRFQDAPGPAALARILADPDELVRWAAARQEGAAEGQPAPDVGAIVASLRRPPPAPADGRHTGAGHPASPFDEASEGLDDLFDLLAWTGGDDVERPTAIAHGRPAVAQLLTAAFEHDWLVRAEVRVGKRVEQVNAEVDTPPGSTVTFAVLPTFRSRRVRLGEVRWARVLTEAEEDACL